MRVLELYSGIGGCAAALATMAPSAQVVAALDVNHLARQVYELNFPHPTVDALIEFIPLRRFEAWQADLWWMSPPCQPFTRRGKQQDADDPRARTFLLAMERLATIRPTYLALENVPAFRGSRVHRRLLDTLDGTGYAHRHEILLCPSQLGMPNRRLRYYLVAGLEPLDPLIEPTTSSTKPTPRTPTSSPLATLIDRTPDPDLIVDADLQRRYEDAFHIVDADDPQAETRTFTSAYGRSPVRSGSYLRQEGQVRYFAPREILRLLGFPKDFQLPTSLTRRKAWQLVGNSLSLPAVRTILASVPGLSEL